MRPYLFPAGAAFGKDNLVLHAESRTHRVDNFRGPLSIQTVLRGSVAWIVDGRALRLDTGCFLVLNHGDAYSVDIDSPSAVATCCVFFQHGFVERMAHGATAPIKAPLDEPDRPYRPSRFSRDSTPAGRCSPSHRLFEVLMTVLDSDSHRLQRDIERAPANDALILLQQDLR
jgi:hypothetical protein